MVRSYGCFWRSWCVRHTYLYVENVTTFYKIITFMTNCLPNKKKWFYGELAVDPAVSVILAGCYIVLISAVKPGWFFYQNFNNWKYQEYFSDNPISTQQLRNVFSTIFCCKKEGEVGAPKKWDNFFLTCLCLGVDYWGNNRHPKWFGGF